MSLTLWLIFSLTILSHFSECVWPSYKDDDNNKSSSFSARLISGSLHFRNHKSTIELGL